MKDVPHIPYSQLFVVYAQEDPRRWQLAVGREVTHTTFGIGIIKSAGNAYLEISFVNDQQTSRKFKSESLAEAQFFSNVQLPTDLEGIETIKKHLQAEHHQKFQQRLEAQKRFVEEKRRRDEAQKQRELEQQKPKEQREKEQVAAKEFLDLKTKYRAQSYREASLSSPLYMILLQIDEGKDLQGDQIEWLKKNHLSDTLAIYFQNEYQKTKDPWKLIKACGCLRDASNPSKALELTDYLLENHSSASPKVMSAILTTRGGAFRNLQDLSRAEQCAKDAIKHKESPYPYNLLGAIYFERGEPEQGEASFLRASELAGSSIDQEAQMQNALKNSGQSERVIVAQFLLKRDPEKYQWAAYYLKQ